MFQSLVEGRPVDRSLLVKDAPAEYGQDLDYLVGMLDGEANVDREFGRHNHIKPRPVSPIDETEEYDYKEYG